MAEKMLERDIQSRTIKYAKSCGFMVKRNVMYPGAETGWPDAEFFTPTEGMFFIEFKATGRKPTRKQQHMIGKLRALGYHVYVVDNVTLGKQVIDSFRARGEPV